MSRRNQEFQTIRSEGGLLPPDVLRRVIDPRGNLKGTKPEDYGLPAGERLNEVITQSWNRLRRHWSEFRAVAAKLPEGEAGTGLTNDKWSLPLLRELGFGLLPTSASPEIAGRSYAITRFFGTVPIHLVGCGLSLDRRAAGVRGAAGGNPHGLVQEVLNRSLDHLWGIVGNGLRLRVLRDNQALSRQSFLEFDLEAMFGAEAYSDFVLLWLVGHATRFAPRDGDRIETCWLEEWTKEAQEQGTRVLKDLRGSVERALQVLGEGFASHPKNTTLREALRSGSLPLADFHGQLLRVVYRLIFLFVAEDRTLEGQALLHPRDESEAARVARERYATHYGTARLRELAGRIKGTRHGDLWRQFQILVGALSGEAACEATRRSLALPALGSFLWSQGSTTALNGAELTNHDFLEALRHLAYTRQDKVLRPVDYRNLGAEELGGVYESLLALTPQVSADGARFTFAEFAGNERKTSGAYYTPDSLVQCLLDSALDPVVEEAIKSKTSADAEKAILGLKVCDPAVGSGHFLVGAAHRLARHLSRVRAQAQGESEPSPLLYQHALRDVIGRCLYGVDVNPMAAELCRVSLWLEALEPGKPLSFLDHHIRVGNSLLGTTPELIAGGLPDNAFDAIEGDDKKVCSALKKRNRLEREGQRDMLHLMVAEPPAAYSTLADRSRGIDEVSDATLDEIKRKAEQFQRLVVSEEYRHAQGVADAWCAAFVWPKHSGITVEPPTSDALLRMHHNGNTLTEPQVREVECLAAQYQFFHWGLAFPEVFADGGFDCVLGNPPWERLKLQEQEWFAARSPEIATAPNAARRRQLIANLKANSSMLYREFIDSLRVAEGEVAILRYSGRYPLCGVGRDINTAAVFMELMWTSIKPRGLVGCITPGTILSGDTTKMFSEKIVRLGCISSLFHFENEELIFPGVHHAFRFCIVSIGGVSRTKDEAEYVFYARSTKDLRDEARRCRLFRSDVRLLNPITSTLPAFRLAKDATLSVAMYRRVRTGIDAWGLLTRPGHFHMSNDAESFLVRDVLVERGAQPIGNMFHLEGVEFVPLYESKMIAAFDHRFGTYADQTGAQANQGKLPETTSEWHLNPTNQILPRYWTEYSELKKKCDGIWANRWGFAIRDITSASSERTAIGAVLPSVAVGGTLMLVAATTASAREQCALLAAVNSFAFDYCARQKVTGTHLNPSIFKQLPLPNRREFDKKEWTISFGSLIDWLAQRAVELTYTAWEVAPIAEECGWTSPPFRWNDDRRFLLRCELDAAFFHLYLPADGNGDWRPAEGETVEERSRLKQSIPTPRDAVAYIMDTFPIIRRKDEERYGGDYRTKRVILEIYDAMQVAIRTGYPYQTHLDPPPGAPVDVAGKAISIYQLDRNKWPANLHPAHPEWEESLLHAWFTIRQKQWTYVEEGQVFPWDGREVFVYTLIPYLVQARPGMKFEFYRDAAVLASHLKRCETLLLEDALRNSYRQVMLDLDWLQFPDAHRLRPRQVREALQAKGILRTDASSGVTTLTDVGRLPPLPPELNSLLPLILTAADNLDSVQRDVLERAELTKLGVTKEGLAKDLGVLMVA